MPSAEKPLVYLILGAAGSGRREVVRDLIESGFEADDPVAVMLSTHEAAAAEDALLPNVTRWTWDAGVVSGELPRTAKSIFFFTDGAQNPVDQVEAFKPWLEAQGGELARVIAIVDCQLAEKNPALLAWYEACVHFADVVLLNRREGVENKWLSNFQTHFKKQFYPCLFEFVKDGRVKNPALLLEPQARRMTHVFDEEPNWVVTDSNGEEIDADEEGGDDEDLEVTPEQDPYLARRLGGRRVKELPDIAKYLTSRRA